MLRLTWCVRCEYARNEVVEAKPRLEGRVINTDTKSDLDS